MTKRPSKEERKTFVQNREKELIQIIKVAVSSIRSSDAWKDYLKTMASFWSYSFRNQLLIAIQSANPSRVAGYNKWLEMGRTVKKGAKAIWILAPMTKVVGHDTVTGDPVRGLSGFKSVAVFDVAQTEGKPLPTNALNIIAQGDAPGFVALFTRLAVNLGFTVEFMDTGSFGGWIEHNRSIKVNRANPTLAQAKTLIHELAHGLMGHCDNMLLPREVKELQAETTAYAVSQALGLDSDEASFNYLALWTKSEPDFATKLENAATVAMSTAKIILEQIEKQELRDEAQAA